MTTITMNPPELVSLARSKTVLLTSYRRDGTPVATPVSLATTGGHVFFRTWDGAWKARRLRRDPRVEVAPSTFRGKQTGPAVRARARLLPAAEASQARRALARRHPVLQGVLVPLAHRLLRYTTVHYELQPAGRGNTASMAASGPVSARA